MKISLLKKKTIKAGIRLLIFFTIVTLVTSCYPEPYREVPVTSPNQSANAPVTQVYFYPQNGQTTEQQSRDHYECYNWAVSQTGFDPSQSSIPPKERVKIVPMPPPGQETAVMAVAGAVLGALIAGPRHAGIGALIGAGSGAIAGAASDASREQYAQQMEEAYANGDQALDAQYAAKARDFRRAMSACLEGRGYKVQ
ncbi:MAG: glycine zipper family protein [Smithella sp.]